MMVNPKHILGLSALAAMDLSSNDGLWPSDIARLTSADEPRAREFKPKAVQKRRAKNRAARKARKANRQ